MSINLVTPIAPMNLKILTKMNKAQDIILVEIKVHTTNRKAIQIPRTAIQTPETTHKDIIPINPPHTALILRSNPLIAVRMVIKTTELVLI
jgi:hypothetical protein